MFGLRGAVSLMIALPTLSASAQIYSGRTADDTLVLSNFRGVETPTLLVAAPARGSATSRTEEAITSVVSEVVDELRVPVLFYMRLF